jgi:biopolymer transport protein ExbD
MPVKFKKYLRIESGLGQIDIAPLIDVVFQLLIFFMLTSNFVVIPGINIKLPKTITSQDVAQKALTIVISSEDIIYLDNKPVTSREITAYLKKYKYDSIFIKADRDASMGTVVAIWDICKSGGIEKIGIATTYQE